MTHPAQPPDRPPFRAEDEIDEVLGGANPNPERVGCPGPETLAKLADRSLPIGDPAYEHLVKCSPCYREFRTLQGTNTRPAPSGASRYAAAAAVMLGLAIGSWFLLRGEDLPVQAPSVAQSGGSELRAEVDLRRFTVLRSDSTAQQEGAVTLPAGLVAATLLLPTGSEPGDYEVQLLDSGLRSRAAATGRGELRDFVTTVRATIDLREVEAGSYQLGVRRQGDDWRFFPARVQ